MTLVKKYLIREFLKLLIITAGGLALSFSLIDLIEALDDFLPHHPAALDMAKYAALHIPKNIIFLLPIAVLLSSLYTVGRASKLKELVSVMAAGGRLRSLFLPFITTGLVLSLFAFALGELAVPICLQKARDIKRIITKKPQTGASYSEGAMWLRAEDGSIVNIKLYVPNSDEFRGLSVFKFSQSRLAEIIQAEEAAYTKAGWTLKKVRAYDIQTGGIKDMPIMPGLKLGSPEIFNETALSPSEMGMLELSRYLSKLKHTGFRNIKLEVEMNSKASFPVINLVMIIIGVSLAAKRALGGLIATASGLILSLVYYFGYTLMLSLAYTSILPPVAAVWAVPLIFSVSAVYLYLHMPE